MRVFPSWPRSMAGKLTILLCIQVGGCWLGGMYLPVPQPPPTFTVVCSYRSGGGELKEKSWSFLTGEEANEFSTKEVKKRLSDGSRASFCAIFSPDLEKP